jgi:hypothetical protein
VAATLISGHRSTPGVIAGLDPAIHLFAKCEITGHGASRRPGDDDVVLFRAFAFEKR